MTNKINKKIVNPLPTSRKTPFDPDMPADRVVEYMGPDTVTPSPKLKREWESQEYREDVFLNENFDDRDYFDSSLGVEQDIMSEMFSPVVASYTSNSEEADIDYQGDKAHLKSSEKKIDTDKLFKIGVGASILFLLFRGK